MPSTLRRLLRLCLVVQQFAICHTFIFIEVFHYAMLYAVAAIYYGMAISLMLRFIAGARYAYWLRIIRYFIDCRH